MSRRILLVCLALLVGYFAVYAGDGMHVIAAADISAPRGEASGAAIPVVLGTLVVATIAMLAWFVTTVSFVIDWDDAKDDSATAVAALAFICAAMVFGTLAGPFTHYGAYPWYWTSKWDFLLFLAFVPMVIVVHGIVVDIIEARRERKSWNNVTSVRRGTA